MNLPALIGGSLAAAIALAGPRAARAIAPEKPPERLATESWQVKDGLPGDAVQALGQASDGRLWVATLGGLVRYDGFKLTSVPVPEALSARASDVSMIVPARDGSVWLGSRHHSPMRFGPGGARGFGPAEGLPTDAVVRALAEDGEGQVWLASSRGLFKFDQERFIPHPVHGLEELHATALAIDADRTLWLGTRSGLFTVHGGRLQPAPGLERTGPVTALHRAGRTLWAAVPGALVAIEEGQVVATLRSEQGLPAALISGMAHDGDGNLWLASAAGLVRVRQGEARLFGAAHGLPAGEVASVLIDRERGLWLGTGSAGLVHLSDRTLDTHAAPPGLEGRETFSICEADDGAMWFGTRGQGAVRWIGGRATWYGEADGLPANQITALLSAGTGAVWVGTPAGLVRWRPGASRHHRGKIEDPGIWRGRVRALYRDRAGDLWIGGDGLLGRLSEGKLTLFSPKEGMLAGALRVIAEDAAGVLWVSGGGGLVRRAGAGFVKATAMSGRTGGQVRSMLLDSSGAFWLTTGRAGLVRRLAGAEVAFDVGMGPEPDMLYGVIEDDDGDLWIGTNKSILRITRASLEAVAARRQHTLQVASFETTDSRRGVVAAQLHQPSAWKTREGHLWFLTQQGAVRIDPRRVPINSVAPEVNMEQVLADGQLVAASGLGRLNRPPDTLEFRYAAVTLLQPRKVRYRRWLEGHDSGWMDSGAERAAVYRGLPEGNYRFRVQASNNDGLWTERGATFSFVVAPPFYRRLWFYLLGLLALLPVAWFVHRSRLARLRARYVGALSERTRMARELHDTLLQGMSNVALQLHGLEKHFDDSPARARRDFDLLRETVSQCLADTRRVVRGLREGELAPGALGPALQRLARRLEDTVAPASAAGDARRAVCQVLIEGRSRALGHAVEDELYRIGQEALTNALRHAQASTVQLRLCYEPARVRLLVEDDGRGFDPDPLAPGSAGLHFGIQGLRERADRIGGSLALHSQTGKGTVVEVTVETAGRAAGSRAPAASVTGMDEEPSPPADGSEAAQ